MRYQVSTELTPQEALQRAIVHFGPGGVGLQITSQTLFGLIFQGGGGYVAITVQPGHEKTVLELETREWDYPVRQFMAQVSRRRSWWRRWWRRKQQAAPPPPRFTILNNNGKKG